MSGREYELVITLKSDLCAGSGYAYAGIIDSDVCYDAYGFPYIAARRLKGCLREAAELIGLKSRETGELFGNPGEDAVKGIHIDNAYIENYGELRRDYEMLEEKYRRYITPQSILAQFTTVKAQTRIEKNGVAKDGSLRYIRTVNHYSPSDRDKEMRFYARVTLPEGREEQWLQPMERIAKALRHIGMNRNRGLGSVSCRLLPCEGSSAAGAGPVNVEEDGDYILKYCVRNTAPLAMSAASDLKTEKYISGRSVLGFFAGAYLRLDGKSAEDEEFRDIFLRSKVKFGGLYPAGKPQGEKADIYYPAPSYINQLKKTKRYVNVSKKIPRTEEEADRLGVEAACASGNGNQPKRLKGKFICLKETGQGAAKILVKEPDTDIVYHHTKKSKKQRSSDGNLLYTAEVLRAGQLFAGEIRGSGRYIRLLAELLEGSTLRFGKSKSAQYGTCVLADRPVILRAKGEKRTYKGGNRILAVLESDAIFTGPYGYTVRCDEVREQIKESLGVKEKACTETDEEIYAEIETGLLSGYYSKWNLQRPAVPVVKAGSTFEFELEEELSVEEDALWTGENNGEGFGRLRIVDNNAGDYRVELSEEEERTAAEPPERAAELFRRIIVEEARERLLLQASQKRLELANPAALGRIMLMLSESVNACPDDPRGQYEDFSRRISSIKSTDPRDKADGALREWICGPEGYEGGLKYAEYVEDLRELYDGLLRDGHSEDAFDKEMYRLWSTYLMAAFVQEKYSLKQKEGSHGTER